MTLSAKFNKKEPFTRMAQNSIGGAHTQGRRQKTQRTTQDKGHKTHATRHKTNQSTNTQTKTNPNPKQRCNSPKIHAPSKKKDVVVSIFVDQPIKNHGGG